MIGNYGYWSSATPGLLILLTDLSEESVSYVNRIINQVIMMNFDGKVFKNRCFVKVLGYDGREYVSGWLRDLAENPTRVDTVKKTIPNRAGGVLTIDCSIPVWIDFEESKVCHSNAIVDDLIVAVNRWSDYGTKTPYVIVFDLFNSLNSNSTNKEFIDIIRNNAKLNTWIFGCDFSNVEVETTASSETCYNIIPDIWKERQGIKSKCIKGLVSPDDVFSLISCIFYH